MAVAAFREGNEIRACELESGVFNSVSEIFFRDWAFSKFADAAFNRDNRSSLLGSNFDSDID